MPLYQERLHSFIKAVNDEKDYIKAHDIGREMLLSGEDKSQAKLFAAIAGLAQQYNKGNRNGYKKFRKMVLTKMEEAPEKLFDEADFKEQLKNMDTLLESQTDPNFGEGCQGSDKHQLVLRLK